MKNRNFQFRQFQLVLLLSLLCLAPASEPDKGGAKQLQLVAWIPAEAPAIVPPKFIAPPETNRFTLRWLTFDLPPSVPASVSLAWDRSTGVSVSGYNIYYGVASRTYTNMIDVGSATNVTISGLIEGTTYYFAATAYNIVGLESYYSIEISYKVPSAPRTPGKLWVTLDGPLAAFDASVTNILVNVGREPGVVDWMFNAGATNRFSITNLDYAVPDYYVSARAQSSTGTNGIGNPSPEFHWPPPLTNFVERTLQYSNVAGWYDVALTVLTNPVGSKFWRWRGNATNKVQQQADSPLGPWQDIAETLTPTVGPLLPAQFVIREWTSWQTDVTPYMVTEP